jgi:hypothetical protein
MQSSLTVIKQSACIEGESIYGHSIYLHKRRERPEAAQRESILSQLIEFIHENGRDNCGGNRHRHVNNQEFASRPVLCAVTKSIRAATCPAFGFPQKQHLSSARD